MGCDVFGINCHVFLALVCGIAALCNFDYYFYGKACERYGIIRPKNIRWDLFYSYVVHFKIWWRQSKKNPWNWCRPLRVRIKKNKAIISIYTLFVVILAALVSFFYWGLYSFIEILYSAINPPISDMGIDSPPIADMGIGSPAFRNVSFLIAGYLTLSIAVLGMILTLIRNILTRQQNTISQQGQITESMGQAITQIGAFNDGKPNTVVRLGGLYSLQFIMQESPRHEDSIAKIFYAYIRENAKKDKDEESE